MRDGDGWSEQARLVASDGAPFDQFGTAVAVEGNATAVGAAFADIDGRINQGAIYTFARTGTAWSETAKLAAVDGIADDNFGLAAAMRDGLLLVGAENADANGVPNSGAVYVYSPSDVIFADGDGLGARSN